MTNRRLAVSSGNFSSVARMNGRYGSPAIGALASRASADRLATILAPPSRGARATAEQWYRRATSRHGDSVKFALQDQAGWSWCSPRFRPRLELRQRRRRNPMRTSDEQRHPHQWQRQEPGSVTWDRMTEPHDDAVAFAAVAASSRTTS